MITFNECLINSVVTYPSLYSSKSFEITKFLVMDHVFNSIGSCSNYLFHVNDMTNTSPQFNRGDRCNWKYQPERLIYTGKKGAWHQFVKVDNPGRV